MRARRALPYFLEKRKLGSDSREPLQQIVHFGQHERRQDVRLLSIGESLSAFVVTSLIGRQGGEQAARV